MCDTLNISRMKKDVTNKDIHNASINVELQRTHSTAVSSKSVHKRDGRLLKERFHLLGVWLLILCPFLSCYVVPSNVYTRPHKTFWRTWCCWYACVWHQLCPSRQNTARKWQLTEGTRPVFAWRVVTFNQYWTAWVPFNSCLVFDIGIFWQKRAI